jgi:hypothetical protein
MFGWISVMKVDQALEPRVTRHCRGARSMELIPLGVGWTAEEYPAVDSKQVGMTGYVPGLLES